MLQQKEKKLENKGTYTGWGGMRERGDKWSKYRCQSFISSDSKIHEILNIMS